MARNPYNSKEFDIEDAVNFADKFPIGSTSQNDIPVGTKLVFYRKTGETIYFDNKGQEHKGFFDLKTNPYMLIKFLSSEPGEIFPSEVLAEKLKGPRMGGEESTPDQRVSDTIKEVRKRLGLTGSGDEDLFIVKKRLFGIKCNVELKT